MYSDNVRNKIIEISKKQECLQELLQMLSREAMIYYKSWKEIFPYFVMTQCNALIYNFDNKDMVWVGEPYLEWLYDSPFQ